jgi:hypothetical protein
VLFKKMILEVNRSVEEPIVNVVRGFEAAPVLSDLVIACFLTGAFLMTKRAYLSVERKHQRQDHENRKKTEPKPFLSPRHPKEKTELEDTCPDLENLLRGERVPSKSFFERPATP